MKKYFIILLALALQACYNTPSYTISGTVTPDMEEKTVILLSMQNGQMQIVDSTKVQGGNYEFKGSVKEPQMFNIQIIDKDQYLLNREIIVENTLISIQTDSLSTHVSGTLNNELLQTLKDKEFELDYEMRKIWKKIENVTNIETLPENERKAFATAYTSYEQGREKVLLDFVRENINNIAGQSQLMYTLYLPVDTLKSLLSLADTAALKTNSLKALQEKVGIIERIEIGQPFVDLRMSDPGGKLIALSDFAGKGKSVLIDFWASWCGPCRHDMPDVVRMYKKYKNKGLEIVGISCDTKKDAWKKAIGDLHMTWPQMSDLKGWQSEGCKLYAVNGIPHTVLLDPSGTIIAKDLRGDELEKKIAELVAAR